MPLKFYDDEIHEEDYEIVRELKERLRFFHWELEFPDVFNEDSDGFTAILGNPPWETLQPVSKEFFSDIDPMFRSYGKQEAIRKQTAYFERDEDIERRWLNYNANFRGMSNWIKYAAFPFGDRITYDFNDRPHHDFNLGTGGKNSFQNSEYFHQRWEERRKDSYGFADPEHSFRYQGSGKPYTYKMFLELSHSILNKRGRMGMIVPSGVYSDDGTTNLRNLFV
ncbi:MAG: Eco57I restriction-modification methylase domain-containing protein, partial [Candidatus Hinthialibacter sp.]